MSFTAKAPGSIMLFGEHAVLHGEPAIVAAVDSYITVSLLPRHDQKLMIYSDQFDEYQADLSTVAIMPPYHFILAAIEHFKTEIPSGFELHIQSDFLPTIGLGSSAAVTVASLTAILQWLDKPMTKQDLALLVRKIIRDQQGIASGADVMASVYGGVIYYETEPMKIERLGLLPDIVLCYVGYKTKTVDVIAKIKTLENENPSFYQEQYQLMGQCVRQAKDSIKQQDWKTLGELMNQYYELQRAIGTSDNTIAALITAMRAEPTILGAKISGSGLGDCIIGLGQLPDTWQQQLEEHDNAKLISVDLKE